MAFLLRSYIVTLQNPHCITPPSPTLKGFMNLFIVPLLEPSISTKESPTLVPSFCHIFLLIQSSPTLHPAMGSTSLKYLSEPQLLMSWPLLTQVAIVRGYNDGTAFDVLSKTPLFLILVNQRLMSKYYHVECRWVVWCWEVMFGIGEM